jgi:hypothetical protein
MSRRLVNGEVRSGEGTKPRQPSADTRVLMRPLPVELRPMPKGERTVNATAGLKRCPQCRTNRPLSAFARNKARHDGLQAQCKACQYPARWMPRKPPQHEPGWWSRLTDDQRATELLSRMRARR